MNRFVVGMLGLVGLVALFDANALQAQAPRLGYINSQVIMAQAPGTTEAQVAFEQDMERYRAELAQLETRMDSLQQNFDRQQATLSPAVRQERQAEIQQTFVQYQTRQTELEEEAQVRQQELVAPIMERIAAVIENLRAEGSYAIIFDASAGSMMAADPMLDLTQAVIARLNAASPAPPSSPATPTP